MGRKTREPTLLGAPHRNPTPNPVRPESKPRRTGSFFDHGPEYLVRRVPRYEAVLIKEAPDDRLWARLGYWAVQYAKVKKPRKAFDEWKPQIALIKAELVKRKIIVLAKKTK